MNEKNIIVGADVGDIADGLREGVLRTSKICCTWRLESRI
jgi:hypothetical protein